MVMTRNFSNLESSEILIFLNEAMQEVFVKLKLEFGCPNLKFSNSKLREPFFVVSSQQNGVQNFIDWRRVITFNNS